MAFGLCVLEKFRCVLVVVLVSCTFLISADDDTLYPFKAENDDVPFPNDESEPQNGYVINYEPLQEGGTINTDLENTLRTLLADDQPSTIQMQALRAAFFRRFQETLGLPPESLHLDYFPQHKRQLAALIRSGYIRHHPSSSTSLSPKSARGTSTIYEKRGISSLARNGELYHSPQYQQRKDELRRILSDYMYDKRIDGDDGYEMGAGISDFNEDNIGIDGELGSRDDTWLYNKGKDYKRDNVATLLRQINEEAHHAEERATTQSPYNHGGDHQNINKMAAIDNGSSSGRPSNGDERFDFVAEMKRSFDQDRTYEKLLRFLARTSRYPMKKRFLGSLAKSNWYRTPKSMTSDTALPYDDDDYIDDDVSLMNDDEDDGFENRPRMWSSSSMIVNAPPEKRHIGSLARLGWLPMLRSERRFNRSSRSRDECRPPTTNGKTKNHPFAYKSLQLRNTGSKRLLLQPAVDGILVRKNLYPKFYYVPKSKQINSVHTN